MAGLNTSWPPPFADDQERRQLAETANDFAIAFGLVVRPHPDIAANPGGILAVPAPVTLFPSLFPLVCFQEARLLQPAYNELYAAISRDEVFLGDLVKEVAKGDDFIAKLWDVHMRVKKEGYVQVGGGLGTLDTNLSLGLFRSDYMVDSKRLGSGSSKLQIKQIEFNTISASFAGLSCKTSRLHRFLASGEYQRLENCKSEILHALPPNRSAARLAAGLRAGLDAYGLSELGRPTCVLFIVQDGERNVFDQLSIHDELVALGARVFRVRFSELLARTTINPLSERRQLLYTKTGSPSSETFEVAVAYLRAGYSTGADYPDGSTAWEARYHLERSAAIKCPTVLTQLAGMKKVQQVLATPKGFGGPDWSESAPRSELVSDALRRFARRDEHAIPALQRTFTDIFPLDNSPAGLVARKLATSLTECENYVLKPQREGGGNNVYRSAIPAHLKTVPEEHWGSFILMELIRPPAATNTILRNGKIEQGEVISELGMYGTILWDHTSGVIRHNEEAGYLLRTKGNQSEEGGVAAGFGCMDSCCLV